MPQEPNRQTDVDNDQAAAQQDDAGQPAAPDAAQSSEQDAVQQLDALRQELDAMKDKYLRALADCQNIQKRGAAERSEAMQRAQADVAKSLLPVLDNFERTLEAAKSAKDVKAVADGVRIIYEQMLKALGEFGLHRMDLKPGDSFDPIYHQAIAQQPSDEVEPGHVLHVGQAGYTMRDRTIRPATVVVATAPEAATADGKKEKRK